MGIFSRRELLGGAFGAWAFLDSSLLGVEQLVKGDADPEDEAFWAELRKQFRPTDEVIAFNNAGLSPSPQMVLDAIKLEMERANGDPSLFVYRRQSQEVESVRVRLAKMLGVSSDHLALTPNATYGLHTGILGVDAKEDREVVYSSHEYPRAMASAQQRSLREGVPVREVSVEWNSSAEALKESLIDGLGDLPLVGVFSTVSYLNGTVLPVDSICHVVKERGGLSLIDGAQSIGIIPTNLVEMGCDMYTACLHKWVMGPVGTGVFYVRPELIDSIWALNPTEEVDRGKIQKFEHWGTRPYALWLAVGAALDFGEMLGMHVKRERISVLRKRLIEGLDGVAKVRILSPVAEGRSDMILSVGIEGYPGSLFATDLMNQFGIHCTVAVRAGLDGVRLSPSIFTTVTECDKVVSAIREIAKR